MAKKNPYRFSLQFDKNDPTHQEVVEILSGEGRKAAQFVANAVLHYKYCENAGRINVDQDKLLLMQIADVVKETLEAALQNVKVQTSQPVQTTKKIRQSAEIPDDTDIDDKDAKTIMDSFQSFLG